MSLITSREKMTQYIHHRLHVLIERRGLCTLRPPFYASFGTSPQEELKRIAT